MFAAAAREAVFSQDAVVREVRERFVPLALKAGSVAQAGRDVEGRFYDLLRRTQPAPQGICALTPQGRPIASALSFDDEASLEAFLAHVRERAAADDAATAPVERYRVYPSQRMDDVAIDDPLPAVDASGHRKTDGRCRAIRRFEEGTLAGRVVGRTFRDGAPWGDAHLQEHYVEDRFEIALDEQAELARAIAAAADGERVAVPDAIARILAGNAFLGMLDVHPLGAVPGSTGARAELDVWARRLPAPPDAPGAGVLRAEIGGATDVEGRPTAQGRRTDGRLWEHSVRLTWRGIVEIRGERVTRVIAVAEGRERLRWGNERRFDTEQPDVARLPAGHPIDIDTDVRYGLHAEPVAGEELARSPEEAARGARQPGRDGARDGPPESLRRKLQQLERAVREARRSGRGPETVLRDVMPRFEPHVRAGRFEQAEALIDEALRRLGGDGDEGDEGGTPQRDGARPGESLEERIERLEREKERIERELRELRRRRDDGED